MQSNKLTGIEAGRGVAALLVVAVHTRDHLFKNYGLPVPIGDWFIFGHAGVDFFFVLSGFIIAWVHRRDIGQPARLGHYVQRRFTRIFPFYWTVCLISLMMLALSTHQEFPAGTTIAASFLLSPFSEPIVSVAWTLQHEIIFYILFATLLIKERMGLGVMALWFLVSLLSTYDAWIGTNPIVSEFNLEFLFGLGAAQTLARRTVPAPLTLLTAGTALFLLAGSAENTGLVSGPTLVPHLGYSVGATLAILGLVEAERQGRLAVPRMMVSLGSASYAIYLTHLICIGVIWQIMIHIRLETILPLWVQFIILSAGGATGGWLLSGAVERPVMTVARNTIERWRALPRPAPADGVR